MTILGFGVLALAAVIFWDADKRARQGELSSGQRHVILLIIVMLLFFGITIIGVKPNEPGCAALTGDAQEGGK